MAKAGEVAAELRRIADAFDVQPEIEFPDYTRLWISCGSKQQFLDIVALLPRPLKKSVFREESDYPDLHVEHKGAAGVLVTVPQKLTCTLIRPAVKAVYECEPILSQLEEDSLV